MVGIVFNERAKLEMPMQGERPKSFKLIAAIAGGVLAGICFTIAAVVIVNGDDGATSEKPETSTSRPGPTAGRSRPARVLMAIDRSASMGCPLQLERDEDCSADLREQERDLPVEDQRLTRFGAARNWAAGGVATLNKPGDKLAISTFLTSTRMGRLEMAEPLVTRVVGFRPLSRFGNLKALFGRLRPTDGGTALYDMVDQGVDHLREGSPTNNRMNSLVILTDGGRNGSSISLEELRDGLAAAAVADEPVRVMVTATGEATCEQLRAFTEPGDGDCFQAPDSAAVACAARKIRELVRKPHPPSPRSAEEKRRDRACAPPP